MRRTHHAVPAPAEPNTLPRCDDCQRHPRHPGEHADIATAWILPGPTGPVIGHFCRDCAPAGPVVDLTCTRCGDGPLLAGDIAHHPEHATPLLTAAGWQLTGQPMCPSCLPVPTPRHPEELNTMLPISRHHHSPTTEPAPNTARQRPVNATDQPPGGSAPAGSALTPDQASTVLEPAEAAALLGITEDSVLLRQRRGELPARLTMGQLYADRLDDRF